MARPVPPVAPRRPHRVEAHGHVRTDDWYWLADRDDPEVLAYLKAENDYTAEVLASTEELQSALYEQIKARVVETDAGPPTRRGPWWYWHRTFEGRQYRVMCRRPDPEMAMNAADVAAEARAGTGPVEQVLLDENVLAGDSDYLAIGVLDVSPDHAVLAYATDLDGSERYTLRFRDTASGEDHPDVIEGVYYGSAWAADSATLFYVRPDHAMRPWQVWRHALGGRTAGDELVYQEDDERFFVDVRLSRSQRCVVVHTASKTSSEARWIDAGDPTGAARIVLPREAGVEYDVEHDGDSWLVRTNRRGPDGRPATNFALYRLPQDSRHPAELQVVLPHRPGVKVGSVDAFAAHTVVGERSDEDGLQRLRVIGRGGDQAVIDQPEPVYSLLGEPNAEWEATSYRFVYTSLVTPRCSVEHHFGTGRRETVWAQQVRGGYNPSEYRTERLWATSHDGTRVPVSAVVRRDQPRRDPAPLLLYGYGAYEINVDPSFSLTRLNLLERGVSYAIAHVRGGGELGRAWYQGGKMENKTNTFADFIAVADHLVEVGLAPAGGLVARGGSAGGLLMGAVVNKRPHLWRAVVAEVPFVDVVTTMSDTSLPLTVTEWDEWGDPVHDPAAYHRILSYSPYDNVVPEPYPAMYVTAGLNDPRVGFWEPAKWVAKLRSVGAGDADRPVLLRTEMGAGHGGSSGRYDAWRDEARIQAFVLTEVGLAGSG
ncbi:MAG: S9 family peptidase [Acidimicrobiales bacterium]